MTVFYENETAVKQLNDLGLFQIAYKKHYLNIKNKKVYVRSDILTGYDLNGNSVGLCNGTIKPLEILLLQKQK